MSLFISIQKFFGFGRIAEKKAKNLNSEPTIYFVVNSLEECLIIRKHFEVYPLLTYKLVYFQL